jgi:RNA polymerase sigma factor (sigma-70 family)
MPAPAGEVWDVVTALPARQREALALRYVADLTESQISEIMGVRRSTVSVLLRRAHERLAALLQERSAAGGS